MKSFFKNILDKTNLYHPIQAAYRGFLFSSKRIFYSWSYSKYIGSGLECNVCGAFYQKFINDFPSLENENAIYSHEVVAGYGENILCPGCLSNARERLVLAILTSKFQLNNKKILHFAPERNIYNYLSTIASITTADLFPGFYKSIDPNIRKEDLMSLSFESESFDVVIANHIMEHIPNHVKAMSEIYRVLKKGGTAIMQIPYSISIDQTLESPDIKNPSEQSALFGQKDHVRIYKLSDYESRLRLVGFDVAILGEKDLAEFHDLAIQKNEVFLMISKPIASAI